MGKSDYAADDVLQPEVQQHPVTTRPPQPGIVQRVMERLGSRLKKPIVRASAPFQLWRNFFVYTPREEILDYAMHFVQESALDGDYLEFGVFRGHTFATAFHMARRYGFDRMHFYAFDSFCGLPPSSGIDAAGFQHFEEGSFACSEHDFRNNLRRDRVELAKVTTVPGWFHEVLTPDLKRRLPLKRAAIVWVDCDLYESTVPVLEFVTEYLQSGTVLIFDDWFCYRADPDRGEQRAWREWLAEHPNYRAMEWRKIGWHGQALIVHRRDSDRSP
ncbi:MAG: TylF/MycF family methyltransferase [Acidobacteriia bacterium]|nr:TylF/MycF family methyltransferase [Terriglobia bacterium]